MGGVSNKIKKIGYKICIPLVLNTTKITKLISRKSQHNQKKLFF